MTFAFISCQRFNMFGLKKKIDNITEENIKLNTKLLDVNNHIAELTQAIGVLKVNNELQQNEINALSNLSKELEATLSEYLEYKKKKEGEQPFIEVISEGFSDGGMELKLDWNEAMINLLKRNGYRGETDDDIIERYLSDMFNDRAKNGPDAIT